MFTDKRLIACPMEWFKPCLLYFLIFAGLLYSQVPLCADESIPHIMIDRLDSLLTAEENSTAEQPSDPEFISPEAQNDLTGENPLFISADTPAQAEQNIKSAEYDEGPLTDIFYKVKPGDTLAGISKKFYGTPKYWRQLARVNKILKPSQLRVGKVIRIPPGTQFYGRKLPVRRPKKQPARITFVKPPAPKPAPVVTTPPPSLPPAILPPGTDDDSILYENISPTRVLPGEGKKKGTANEERRAATLNGITGLTKVMSGSPLGDGKLNVGFHIAYQKITSSNGNELRPGEDGTLTEFPLTFTYSTAQFETGLLIPFKSYDIYAPVSLAYQSGTDSGLGDVELNMKFSNKTDLLATAIGIGVIFPTDDTIIGSKSSTTAWQLFGALSTLRKFGGNVHLMAGYRSSSDNTDRDMFFSGIGFDYTANDKLTFLGEVTNENVFSGGQSTDLTLGLRYLVKEGMNLDLFTPISLSNDRYIGYDYKVVGGFQYKY
ncbi:LysM peptidoglycan-binding domain-containing protein [Candidatus Riflebacteria bacterium]